MGSSNATERRKALSASFITLAGQGSGQAMTMLTVVGIHGIGSHSEGSVRLAILTAASEAEYQTRIDELHWSNEVDVESYDDAFRLSNGPRTHGAMLCMASQGFQYFKAPGSGMGRHLVRFVDSIVFTAFHVMFLLLPIAVGLSLYNLWFETKSLGPGEFLAESRVVGDFIFTWTAVLGGLSLASGIGVQLLKCSTDRSPCALSFWTAACVSARRLTLYIINTLWIAAVAPMSTIWIRVVLFYAALLALLSTALFYSGFVDFVTDIFISPELSALSPPLRLSKLLWIAGGCAIVFVLLHLLFFIARPVAKLVADICLYVGDEEHRDKLQRMLDDRLKAAEHGAGSHLILVGHSLGSVIAVDYLRTNAQRLRGASSVTLITMGSPLARLLHRFFPHLYPRPAEILRRLTAIFCEFRWLNIFRPLDPVGAHLGIASEPSGLERSTEQVFGKSLLFWNVLAQHLNYFGDARVREICWEVLPEQLTSPRERRHAMPAAFTPFGSKQLATQQVLKACTGFAWALGSAVILFLVFVQLPRSVVGVEEEAITSFKSRSVTQVGRLEVGQRANLWVFGKPIWPDYATHVVFIPEGMKDEIRAAPLDVNDKAAFSWAAAGKVEDHGLVNLAVREGVEVRYDPEDPKRCEVPIFRSGRWTSRNGNLFNLVLLSGVLLLAWTGLLFLQCGPQLAPTLRWASKNASRSRRVETLSND